MPQNDIYNSMGQWESIVKKINDGTYLKPSKDLIYPIRNKENIKYFKKIVNEFDYKEISYIRRIGYVKALRKTAAITSKDFKDLTQEDVKGIIAKLNAVHKATTTKRAYVDYNKYIWKIILPEKDNQGREDNTIVPHAWRVEVHTDKSQKKIKKEKITEEEYTKIQQILSNDPRMQTFFSLLYRNLARPQEVCFIEYEDVDVFDNYAIIHITKGKEGAKDLQVVDDYYYLTQWLNKHPLKKGPLFITLGNNSKYQRLGPKHANKILRTALKDLGIDKRITNYTFKRSGVTNRYINGEAAQDIQKIAGWTSTTQLKTYDLSEQKEFFEKELIKKGIMQPRDREEKRLVTYKQCGFCNEINPNTNSICSKCERPLDRDKIIAEMEEKDDKIKAMEKQIADLKAQMPTVFDFKTEIDKMREVMAKKLNKSVQEIRNEVRAKMKIKA